MIPVLFKKNEQQFRTYGLGEITDIINPKVTRERNGQYLLYFQYPQNAEFSDVFEEDMRIKSDAGVRTKWQTFEISRVVRKEGQLIEVFAKHISQSLLKDALNPSINVRSSNAQQALRIWNNNRIGDEEFDVWSDISTTSSTSWDIRDVSNAFEALAGVQGSILDVWGGEYEFDNKMIRLHKEMGRKSPVPLEYGRNITGLEQDQQDDNVYTSVYPFATYIPESGSAPETVTLPERYIDGKYLEVHNKRKIQVVDFSGEYDNDNPPTVSSLRTLANRYLEANEVGLPHENLKIEYIDLSKTLDYQDFQTMEEVELNDRLPIFYPKFGITNENAKVVVVNYDPVKEENISIELGVIGQSFRTVTTGGIGSRLDRVEKQQDVANNYIVNNKGNRIWFETPDENMEHKIGDTWFEKNGQYDRIRVWNGNQWEIIIDTEDVNKIAKEVAQAQQDIAEAQATADNAITEIEVAIDAAGFTSLSDSLTGIQQISQTAQSNAENALTHSLNAISDASTALSNSTDALSQVANIDVRVDDVEGTLELKADKQEVDTLSGIVDAHTLDIQANAEGLALKANQDTVDTLAGTVQSLGTEFDIVAGQVNSRVWNTDIETAIDGIEVGGRNLILNSGGMHYLENTNETYRYDISPYVTVDRLKNAKAITLSFDIETEDVVMDSGWIVLELQVRDEEGTLHFLQNSYKGNGSTVFRKTVTHYLDELSYNIESIRTAVMYVRNYTGKVGIGNPSITFGELNSDWTPAPEDTLARFDHIETEWTQTFDSFSQTVTSIDGRVSKQEQTVSGMQSVVYDPETGLSSLNTQLANLVQVAVTGEEMTGAISVLENNINARVEKGDVINQINISDEDILIQANKIMALGDVVVDGKLTITDEFIAANAQIDGAKIGEATIASGKIISLDVSQISGNTTNFVRSAWNAINSNLTIDGTSLKVTTSNTWDMHLGNAGVTFTGKTGTLTGSLRATRGVDGEPEGTLLVAERGYLSGLGRRLSSGSIRASVYVEGNSGDVTVTRPMRTEQSIEIGAYNQFRTYQDPTVVAFEHRPSISRDYKWSTDRIWSVSVNTRMDMYADINMNGRSLYGQSDIRLKKNIEDSNVNALREIERLRFIEFDWDTSKRPSDSKPAGRQFGLVAQYSPFLQTKMDGEDSYLSTDITKQINLNSKGLQELICYTRSLEKRIEELEGAI